jgi:cell division septation protein DedD
MKNCPKCYRSYSDETLTYCLEDGSLLSASFDSEATQRIPPSRITNLQSTEVLPPTPSVSKSIRQLRKPLLVYLVIGLLALIAGGIIMAWMKSNSIISPNTKSEVASNSSPVIKEEISSGNTNSAKEKESLQEEKAKLEREKQELAEERKRLEAKQNESTSSTTRQLPSPSSGTYFVVLGSYPKNDYEKANQRLRLVQGLGYEASLIDSDNYPGLSGGLWVVVIGPYSKSYAKSLATQIKPARSDVYIKSGW